MLIKIWLVIFLIICAITDILERKVYTMFCVTNGVIIMMMQFFIRDSKFTSCVFGALLGVVFYFFYLVNREYLGIGDVIIVGIMGIATGFQVLIEILVWTFMIIVAFTIAGVLIKKINLKTQIPLVPFLLLGTLLNFFVRG